MRNLYLIFLLLFSLFIFKMINNIILIILFKYIFVISFNNKIFILIF